MVFTSFGLNYCLSVSHLYKRAAPISFMMAKGSALAMAEGFQGAGSGAVMGVAKNSGKSASDGLKKSGENKKAKASQATQATQHRQVLRALRIGRKG
jgi:hypothetical protein